MPSAIDYDSIATWLRKIIQIEDIYDELWKVRVESFTQVVLLVLSGQKIFFALFLSFILISPKQHIHTRMFLFFSSSLCSVYL